MCTWSVLANVLDLVMDYTSLTFPLPFDQWQQTAMPTEHYIEMVSNQIGCHLDYNFQHDKQG